MESLDNMNYKNLIAGLMFIGFSLVFLTNMSGLLFGTTADIGPGFFPTVISVCLLIVGVITMFKKND